MLTLQRVCVPLGIKCNLHCKYCFRDHEKLEEIPDFTPNMIAYLQKIDPNKTEAVCASGGEPLLYWDKVKELFSYVPKNVHKKIMSNCTLLTQEIVDYLNDNMIELHASHDGAMTQFLRGVDVLENEKTRDLLRQVKILRIMGVVTKYNNDVWANFFDTAKKLGRTDFMYDANPIWDIPSQHDLIDGFDYDLWFTTFLQFRLSSFSRRFIWYGRKTLEPASKRRPCGFNILPNGRICGMIHMCSDYGSIEDSYEDCFAKLVASGDMDACIKRNCKYTKTCIYPSQQCASDHVRKCRMMLMEQRTPERYRKTRKYVAEHLEEIQKKYGYI